MSYVMWSESSVVLCNKLNYACCLVLRTCGLLGMRAYKHDFFNYLGRENWGSLWRCAWGGYIEGTLFHLYLVSEYSLHVGFKSISTNVGLTRGKIEIKTKNCLEWEPSTIVSLCVHLWVTDMVWEFARRILFSRAVVKYWSTINVTYLVERLTLILNLLITDCDWFVFW